MEKNHVTVKKQNVYDMGNVMRVLNIIKTQSISLTVSVKSLRYRNYLWVRTDSQGLSWSGSSAVFALIKQKYMRT
jgi:hypothetical protein